MKLSPNIRWHLKVVATTSITLSIILPIETNLLDSYQAHHRPTSYHLMMQNSFTTEQ